MKIAQFIFKNNKMCYIETEFDYPDRNPILDCVTNA